MGARPHWTLAEDDKLDEWGREQDDEGSDRGLRSNATTQTKGQNMNKDRKVKTQRLMDSSAQIESERGGSQSCSIAKAIGALFIVSLNRYKIGRLAEA